MSKPETGNGALAILTVFLIIALGIALMQRERDIDDKPRPAVSATVAPSGGVR